MSEALKELFVRAAVVALVLISSAFIPGLILYTVFREWQ